MTLTIEFNFSPADKCDPQSQDDLEIVEMWLGDSAKDNKVPDRAQNDVQIVNHLTEVLYRLRQIMPYEHSH